MREAFSKFVFFNGYGGEEKIKDTVKIRVVVCGKEDIKVNNLNGVFNIDTSQNLEKPEISFNLSKAFEVVTTADSMLVSDCPIIKFALCKDELCETQLSDA